MSTSPPYIAKVDQPFPSPDPMLAAAGNYPITCNCPYCQQPIMTKPEKDSGLAVWLSAGLIFFLGCFCGCCLIPFCIDDLKDTVHYCPNCNRILTINKKFKL